MTAPSDDAHSLAAENRELQARLADCARRLQATRDELATSHQVLEGTFQSTRIGIAYLDCDFNFVRVNRAYAAFDHRTEADFTGKNHFDLYPNADNQRIFERVRDTGEPFVVSAKPFEYAHSKDRGVTHWDWTLMPVKNESGRVCGLVLSLLDVTDRVLALEASQSAEARGAEERQTLRGLLADLNAAAAELEARLAEKEILLKEIHHRVKNNLQVISSMLYLQSAQSDEPAVAALFRDSRDRVRAMALVHETLYESAELGRVDFHAYAKRLVAGIATSFEGTAARVRVEIVVDAPPLAIHVAIPCGLITNELVSNAYKYAFEGRASGCVRVSLTAEGSTRRLTVHDDGVGMPESCLSSSKTLGIRLVRALAGQLGGQLEVGSGPGTTLTLAFPADDRPSSRDDASVTR